MMSTGEQIGEIIMPLTATLTDIATVIHPSRGLALKVPVESGLGIGEKMVARPLGDGILIEILEDNRGILLQ